MKYTSIVFDAYGTLFDINAAAQKSALVSSNSILQRNWKELAEIWRKKQIEYTWLQNILDSHTDFLDITEISLEFALEEMTLDQEPKLRETLLDLYRTSEAYPEVAQVLEDLCDRGVKLSILSNGTPEMLLAACASTKIEKLLDFIVSVEEIGIFKPDGKVYELINTKMRYKTKEVLFVSSNGWDIMGANKFGFSTAWVNRNKKPVERMQWKPNYELSNLMHVINLFK